MLTKVRQCMLVSWIRFLILSEIYTVWINENASTLHLFWILPKKIYIHMTFSKADNTHLAKTLKYTWIG